MTFNKMETKQKQDQLNQNTNITNTNEDALFNNMKTKYLKLMDLELAKKSPLDQILCKNTESKVIDQIKWMKTTNSKVNSEWSKKYDIVNNASSPSTKASYILTPVNDPLIQVLSYEDCFEAYFDAFYQIPNWSKLNFKTMLSSIKRHYCMSEVSLRIFLKCLLDPNLDEKKILKFNDKVELHILEMYSNPDCNFRFILLYTDIATNFYLMRPLLEFSEQELASELYQIFMDFGPPKAIGNGMGDLLTKAMLLIQNTAIKYDCEVNNIGPRLSENAKRVSKELQDWIVAKNPNWAVGCYVIQYSLNNNPGNSLYKKLFNKKQNTPNFLESTVKSSDNYIGKLTNPIERVKEKNVSDKITHSTMCNQCNSLIRFKTYKCQICEHTFHLVCVNRILIEEKETLKSKIVCFTCNLRYVSVNNDIEVIK